MSDKQRWPRRSFLAKAGAGAAAVGAALSADATMAAQSASPQDARFQPERHAQDDWLDQVRGKHRFFLDTITAEGLGQALFYANNYYVANKSGYGLEGTDLALVICLRHQSTAFAFTDLMWQKYGKGLSERASFTDPKTNQPPAANLYRAAGYGGSLANNGITLDAMIKNGAHFAVCQLATRACASVIARDTGRSVDDIYQELVANTIPNAHMVPAGIVTVNRAQERGYAFGWVG
jgi:hypothetical protein